jgi:prolyl 4-hydroxylase
MILTMMIRLLLLLLPYVAALNPQSRDIRIINEAGFKCNIYWINRWKNDELVLNSEEGVFHGAETKINSYISHEFEVQEIPSKNTGKCKGPNDTCRKGYFQVNSNDEQLVIFTEGLAEIVHTDNKSKARDQAKDVLQECKASSLQDFDPKNPEVSMNQLLECLDRSIDTAVEKKQDEIEFQQNLRFEMGSKLVGYSCVDPNVTMSESIENKTWTYNRQRLDVKVLFDRPSSKITYIENFITDEECDGVQSQVNLVDIKGDNGLWAKKGGVDIAWDKEKSAITHLANKMYRYVADALHLSLESAGTEQMFMLQYTGDKENPSRYDSHCDGACDGSQHKQGDRIATMIAYCQTADKGGHTHFSNAGIHVIPQKGSAVFYSYYDPATQLHDTGFTKHAGCGVTEGTKTIVTHKIRI